MGTRLTELVFSQGFERRVNITTGGSLQGSKPSLAKEELNIVSSYSSYYKEFTMPLLWNLKFTFRQYTIMIRYSKSVKILPCHANITQIIICCYAQHF